MYIVNLTQHAPTPEQEALGVQQPLTGASDLLTFLSPPTVGEIARRAEQLAELAASAAIQALEAGELKSHLGEGEGEDRLLVMIGGAMWLMGPLERTLRDRGLTPVYAFSERVSEEHVQPDGSIKKVQIFRHAGWVGAGPDYYGPTNSCPEHGCQA